MEELILTESRMDNYEQSSRKMVNKRKQEAPKRKIRRRKLSHCKDGEKDLKMVNIMKMKHKGDGWNLPEDWIMKNNSMIGSHYHQL